MADGLSFFVNFIFFFSTHARCFHVVTCAMWIENVCQWIEGELFYVVYFISHHHSLLHTQNFASMQFDCCCVALLHRIYFFFVRFFFQMDFFFRFGNNKPGTNTNRNASNEATPFGKLSHWFGNVIGWRSKSITPKKKRKHKKLIRQKLNKQIERKIKLFLESHFEFLLFFSLAIFLLFWNKIKKKVSRNRKI